jgi:hypothetical protein
LLPEKCGLQCLVGEPPNFRFFGCAGASYIENTDAIILNEPLEDQGRRLIARWHLAESISSRMLGLARLNQENMSIINA